MKTMQIYISPNNTAETLGPGGNIGQTVHFINVLNGEKKGKPTEVSYKDRDTDSEHTPACLLNYEKYSGEGSDGLKLSNAEGYAPITNSEDTLSAIYKQEIGPEGEELTRLKPVSLDLVNFKFRDFNISNHRRYQYVLYPFDKQTDQAIEKVVQATDYVNWVAWSITELHPVDRTMKKFTATEEDVWLFNLNVETGEQTQTLSRNEQQTLGVFSKFSQGKTNYVSGSVTCLLGRDVLPATYIKMIKKQGINALKENLSDKDKEAIKKNNTIWLNKGGYQEKLPVNKTPTSNQQVDMLLAWRKMVYSSNPKLLKDREGQSFLITINSSTNKPMDAARIQPNTISFNWTQIGATDDLQILDNSL